MGAALALSSVLSNPPPAGFTQHQVDEKIAASTAPIQAQLDATQKTMVDLRNELTAAKGESAATKQALDETRHNLSAMQEQNKQLSAGLTPAPVQNPEYRRISLEQMRILVREFAALKPDIPHIVVFRSNDVRGEANQYARDFMEAFDRAGLNPSGGTLSPNGLDETGVMIGVTDPTNSPPIAQKLAAALSRAAIQSSYAKVDGNLPDGFRFFVGPNPL
jgi:outer membrane murein-binding lipoprotein Lpp